MGSRWSIRRRTAPSRSLLPQWQQSKTSGIPEKQATTSQPVVRTEVVVNPASGSKGPRTVITIRRAYRQPAPETPASPNRTLQPAFNPPVAASRAALAPLKPESAPISADPEPESLGENLESFGIDAPGSPSSTLNDLSESIYSQVNSVTASTSMSSLHSVATAIDDGLSPWGLPKVMDCSEDPQEVSRTGTSGFDYDGDLDSVDFGSALTPAADVADEQQTESQLAIPGAVQACSSADARKQVIRVLAYTMELVAKHRAQHEQPLKVDKRAGVPTPWRTAPRTPDLNISHFGSWI